MIETEVTIYEQLLEKHSRLIDREERDHVAAMKAERDYFNKMNPQGTIGGGFLYSIIKGMTSKGILGGLAAGGAAGGVLVLADVIKDLTKQSKILTTVQDTVGKALGTLVDLVLLPFLPILIFGLLYLYTAIMWVGKIWNDWISKSGVGEAASKVLFPGDKSALERTIDFVSLINQLAKAWVDGMAKLVLSTALFFGELFANILKFGIELVTNIAQELGKSWLEFQKWIVDKVRDLITTISEAWTKVVTDFDTKFLQPLRKAIDSLRDMFINMVNFVITKINDFLPPGFKINTVPTAASEFEAKWNAARAQENGGSGTTVVNNFNGFTVDQLPGMVENALRQAGDRLNSGSSW